MKETKKIVIADTGDNFRKSFAEKVNNEPDMEIIGETRDGEMLLRMIHERKPDLIVMDSVLEHMDGFEVLDHISGMDSQDRPKVIFLSRFIRGNMIELAAQKGADYFMEKPCKVTTICERIRQLMNNDDEPDGSDMAVQNTAKSYIDKKESDAREKRNMDMEVAVTAVIREIGIPAHIKGYPYLREAILTVINDTDIINAVTKELYPLVAERFNTTPIRVERAMRHAIEVAWDRGNLDILQKYFGYSVSGLKGRPTNSEFIAMIADHVLMQQRNGYIGMPGAKQRFAM